MLARIYRLNKSTEIKRVLSRGRYYYLNGLLLVKLLPNKRAYSRVTVIVSQKVSKKAVVRNKIRRSLVGIITKDILMGNKPLDIVVVVRGVTLKNIKQARLLLLNFLKKLNKDVHP